MSEFDMERICRLCCTIKNRMRPLFEKHSEYPLTLSQMIYAIADLKVDPNDGLPQNICLACVISLAKIYQTIQSYRENDSNLRKQLNRAKPDDIEDMVETEEISVKQECADLSHHEPEPLLGSKPTNETDERQDADARLPAEQDIHIKNEPLDEHDEDSQLDANPSRAADVSMPKLGRVHSKAGEPNRLNVFDYKCYICKSESHGTAHALLVHLNTNHTDLLPFTCSECIMQTVVLYTLRGLNKHLRQHQNRKKRKTEGNSAQQCPRKCHQCDKEYFSKDSLRRHVKLVHSASTTVSCEACGIVFGTREKLRTHFQRQHGQSSKQFDCKFCQQNFCTLLSLENHLNKFHLNSNQEYKCRYCPKAYSTKDSRQAHERMHTDNLNHKAKQKWRQHYTTIEGQEGIKKKKFKCNICGLAARYIREHIQAKHFPITYECDVCGKTYQRLTRLRCHKACHKRAKQPDQSNLLHGKQPNIDKPGKSSCKQTEADAGVGELPDTHA